MNIQDFRFGSIRIDGATYEHDVVIDRERVYKRKKKLSKEFKEEFGHTPLSVRELIPWDCKRLVIGTGAYSSLPVMEEVQREAERRGVELVVLSTAAAIEYLHEHAKRTNAILHVTC